MHNIKFYIKISSNTNSDPPMKMFYPKLIGSYVFSFIFKIQKVDDTDVAVYAGEYEQKKRSEIEQGIYQHNCCIFMLPFFRYSGRYMLKKCEMWMDELERRKSGEKEKKRKKCTNA